MTLVILGVSASLLRIFGCVVECTGLVNPRAPQRAERLLLDGELSSRLPASGHVQADVRMHPKDHV